MLSILAIALVAWTGAAAGEVPLISAGKDSFVFRNEALNAGRPLTVLTYLPENYNAGSPILFVIHGDSRTAESYREAWIEIAERNNALLLAPHFSEAGFPKSDAFNLGNMFELDSLDQPLAARPENEWSYSLIDPLFDFVVAKMKNHSKGYFIYGHSAGSQFLHRLIFFKPGAKILKAVCANAGWYTMPDFDEMFPYGLKGAGCDTAALRAAFAKQVTVLLGDADTDPNHEKLRRTPQAMKQGAFRFERGRKFYEACRRAAELRRIPFAWKMQVAPGVAHRNRDVAPHAAKILFGEKSAANE